MKALTITLILIALMTYPPPAQALEVTFTWSPPTTGSPVDHYVFEIKTGSGLWIEAGQTILPEFVYDMPTGTTVARVAAVDGFDRQGVYSAESDPFTDLGAPGACASLSWSR